MSPDPQNPVDGPPQAAEPVTGPLPAPDDTTVRRVPPPDPADRPSLAETVEKASAVQTRTTPGDRGPPVKVAIPGYEIERELGRGGMGVVYLARQLSLKRPVALKLLLHSATASEGQIGRFQVEVEAVAALQHPNIVQVYEFGEHDGHPFCSLEYAPGGSLAAALKTAPRRSPADAAALVQTLARAVQHAHQRGVVHRDLKPANILLAADGTPKVADFGLAKRLEHSDSAQTSTGQVMGTPAYMAPEQAAGKTHDIGPACDVYALGAILYELLTGRTPFQGTSVIDTIQKVIFEEPESPSRHVPGLPRDLETVCLKCLAKDQAGRYPSALALAQDLERFAAGEPILARPEGVLRRLVRKGRKRRVLIGLTVAAVAAVAAAGVATWAILRAGTAGEAVRLSNEVTAALDAPDWGRDHRERTEEAIGRLEAVAPDQAAAARQRLLDRTARHFRDALARPRVTAADTPELEAELAWLATRDPALTSQLDGELRGRLRSWQAAFDLSPPFANLGDAFPPGAVRADAAGLVLTSPTDQAVRTLTRAGGAVRVEAAFAPGWEKSHQFGLDLRSADAESGYSFLLVAIPRPKGEGNPPVDVRPTFEATGGYAAARILRNGELLRETPVGVPTGPLRLLAEREGDTLRLRVNGRSAGEFVDPFAVPADAQAPGVLWPVGAAVARLRVEVQVLPPSASPLERADALYDRGRFTDALDLYREQARLGGDGGEARYKVGMCELRLGRQDDAAADLEGVMTQPGDRWPVVAACQLWLLRLERKQFDEAGAVFDTVSVRYTRDQIARFVPQTVQHEIGHVGRAVTTIELATGDKDLIRRAEARLKIGDLINEPHAQSEVRLRLAVVLAAQGENDRAAALLREAMALPRSAPPPGTLSLGDVFKARWYGWLMQATDRAGEARWALEGRLYDATWQQAYEPVAHATLRVPYARLLIAVREPKKAEEQLDEYLRSPAATVWELYTYYAEACLMKSYLAADRGEAKAAEAAVKRSTYRAFVAGFPADRRPAAKVPEGRWGPYYQWVTAALADDLSDADAELVWKATLDVIANDPLITQTGEALKMTPAVLRGVWTSDRGRTLARRGALGEATPVELMRGVPRLVLYEKFRQDLFDGKPSAAQEAVVWDAVERASDSFFDGKLTKLQMLPLAMAWKGTAGTFGWATAAPNLPAEVRGPMAYVLGFRYLQLKKPADAKKLFQTALADAPADSPLKTLAQTELARLDK